MPFFNTHNVQLLREVKDPVQCGTDSYGKPLKCTVTVGTAILGDLQRVSGSEQQREFGNIVQGRYKVYLDEGVEVTPEMKVEIDGQTYQVEGNPVSGDLIPGLTVYLLLEG